MSGFDGKVKARDAGVTAANLVASATPTRQPGKTNPIDTYSTGVAYVDNDATCTDKGDSVPGCFLSNRQRDHLIVLFLDETQVAQTNYKLALEELRIDKLIEKDDDLEWVVGLVLDLATSHFSTIAGKALNKLKSKSITKLEDIGLEAASRGEYTASGWQSQASDALRKVSDKDVETAAKTSFDLAKKQTSKAAKAAQNAEDKTERAATLSYIDRLKEQCDVGFQAFKREAIASASDAELVVLLQGMDATQHTIGQYKTELAAKIARYKKSGAMEVGQRAIVPMSAHVATTFTSKRCVWLRGSGSPTLWFYTVLGASQEDPWKHGRSPELERVPDEFVDAALARSEQAWGPTPTFENPGVALERGMGIHPSSANSAPVASAPPRLQLDDVPKRKEPS